MDTEILISVGGGPSGAAAAVRRGNWESGTSCRWTGIDFPRSKTCGPGLSPAALHVAEALGIGP